jgi:hypothetical protein
MNLPPGFYAIEGFNHAIEVKEGVETKLPESIKYAVRPPQGGG